MELMFHLVQESISECKAKFFNDLDKLVSLVKLLNIELLFSPVVVLFLSVTYIVVNILVTNAVKTINTTIVRQEPEKLSEGKY